jgi:hypothetical protein
MKCEPGKANKMIFDLTKDGTKTLKEVSKWY